MFRLPFAAGKVFSVSMLDTLLYQVAETDMLTDQQKSSPSFWQNSKIYFCWLVCCVLLPVICEGLHDLHHQAAAGFRLHAWLRFPLCCKSLNTNSLNSARQLCEVPHRDVCFLDENHRRWLVDPNLRQTLPEAVLILRRHSHRHLPNRSPQASSFWGQLLLLCSFEFCE